MKTDKTIAIAKGICIMLMVLGHSLPLGMANNWVHQFHVALFFFVSGYFFSQKKVEEPLKFIKKKITGLYFPYLKYALFFLLIHNLLVSFHVMPDHYDLREWLYRLYLITTHFSGHDVMLGGFWFIKELFLVSILYLFIRRYLAKDIAGILPWMFVLLFGSMVMSVYKIEIPWVQFTHRTLFGTVLFGMGEWAHAKDIKAIYSAKMAFAIFPVTLLTAYLSRYYFESTGTALLIFLFLSLCGIYACLSLSDKIQLGGGKISSFLCFVGQNTMVILGMHFLSFKIVSYAYILIKAYSLERLSEFPGLNDCYYFLWPFHTLVGIAIPLLLVWIYGKIVNSMKSRKQ